MSDMSASPLSIIDLMKQTLMAIAEGETDSDRIRQALALHLGLERWQDDYAKFVNSHAWALVRLQAESQVIKDGNKTYRITATGRATLVPGHLETDKPVDPIVAGEPLPGWAEHMRRAKNRSNSARWPEYNAQLSVEDMLGLWDECDGRCSVTEHSFSNDRYGMGAAKRAFVPSLDRIDPQRPYCRTNCRFVLVAVNFALNAFGDEVFDRLVLARSDRIPAATARRLRKLELEVQAARRSSSTVPASRSTSRRPSATRSTS